MGGHTREEGRERAKEREGVILSSLDGWSEADRKNGESGELKRLQRPEGLLKLCECNYRARATEITGAAVRL